MKTSTRPRDLGGSFASRRGHGAQLSISDTSHHVTEAIGDMYGDDDYSKRDSRPLSFVSSPLQESLGEGSPYFESKDARTRPAPSINGHPAKKSHTSPGMLQSSRSQSFEKGPISPSLSLRDRNNSDPANAQYPLSNIDSESDPAAIAQELSNLQALRRMSMDVGNTSDPDLPSFQGVSLMPTVAPTGDDNEDDPSRLFWVPARVHPELAPMEFKTFLENRVQTIKRRSGEQTSLSPDGLDRSGSGGGLRRKKSMLSRQIDNDGGRGAVGYKDGSEQLERKKSLSGEQSLEPKISDLQELDALIRDPSRAMHGLTLDTGMGGEVLGGEDMPILPQAPGVGLRRSTRTTYRKGSLRKGERVPFSKRAGSLRGAETDGEESPVSSPIDGRPGTGIPLTKVHSEPSTTENFSRPNRGARRMQNIEQPVSPPSKESRSNDFSRTNDGRAASTSQEDLSTPQPQPGSLPRANTFPRNITPVPQIIETPPPPEDDTPEPPPQPKQKFPERSSSQTGPPLQQQSQNVVPEPPARSSKRPVMVREASSNIPTIPRVQTTPQIAPPQVTPQSPSQTLNEMAQHPSPLPGSSASTESLTFIPTLDDRKPEKKSRKEKDDSENSGSRKPSWGWFKGSDEKEKKDKKREEESKKNNRSKVAVDKGHDNARLDVLQSTMDTAGRGRESIVLERESMDHKLQDERKKESSRKSGGESKKEKEGLFSSFFGGGKKKADRDSGGKKGSSLRSLSPDPPHRQLKPDIDYPWTRFAILEERAIYRMAHIKLANPRRALYSQVLLSNFMYSYLAKVQQMHPQMQIPQSALQKKQEAERKQKELEKQQREEQQHRQEGEEQYRYDYHSGITQYAEPPQNSKQEGVNYVDDSQIYDYDHQSDDPSHNQGAHRPQSRAAQHGNENGYSNHNNHNRDNQNQNSHYTRQSDDSYQYSHFDRTDHDEEDDDDMW